MRVLLLSSTALAPVFEAARRSGKTRVSQHARKRLKFLFHLAAMSAIQVKAGRPVPRVAGSLSTKGGPRQDRIAEATKCWS